MNDTTGGGRGSDELREWTLFEIGRLENPERAGEAAVEIAQHSCGQTNCEVV
ncbi:uncharacterized protein HHUB_3494 [Halobacterium hubeiense]|uniref:Uncharacterized protein n=1 Tax=Halobacterium hubeiense TaxID=1407499 RepID=A0A0U5H4N2_9EURY|nr:uncharacterized protein HHUB_3494 [Halobacterium hubeiense]